uniref:C2H2-type domain-containing protein n=1 Tax=Sphaeramia orbicularis TaxID=375764 RepID=A0A673AAS8_9TELE
RDPGPAVASDQALESPSQPNAEELVVSWNNRRAKTPQRINQRDFTCSVCDNRLHQFKLHQQSHKRKRAFWCTVCGKSFQCSSHLSIHHRTHTGEKPYGCGQCGKRFTQQSSLRKKYLWMWSLRATKQETAILN